MAIIKEYIWVNETDQEDQKLTKHELEEDQEDLKIQKCKTKTATQVMVLSGPELDEAEEYDSRSTSV